MQQPIAAREQLPVNSQQWHSAKQSGQSDLKGIAEMQMPM